MPTNKLGHFSQENYGDREVLSANGQTKSEKRASALIPSIKKLTSKQWFEIIAAAKQFAFDNRSESSGETMSPDVSDDDGFVLVQSDSDSDVEGASEF